MHILATLYLEEGALYFTKVTRIDEKINKDSEKQKRSPIQKKRRKKRALCKEKRNMWALLLVATCFSASTVLMFGLSTFSSVSMSTLSMPLSKSVFLSTFASVVSVPVLELSAFLSVLIMLVLVPIPGLLALLFISFVSMAVPRSLALSFMFAISMPVLGLFAPLFLTSVSPIFVPVPRLPATPSPSTVPVPEPELSLSPFLI